MNIFVAHVGITSMNVKAFINSKESHSVLNAIPWMPLPSLPQEK